MYKVMKPNKAVLRKNRCRFLDYFTEEWNVCYSVWCSWASGEQGILLGCLNNLPVEIAVHSQPSTSFNEPSIGLSKFLNLLCTCPQYQCSGDLLDDRRGSLKFITPLDVSFEKRTKYWLSMTIGVLTSSNLRNWNSVCARNSKYLSLSSTNTFARYFESHWRKTWRHTGRRAASPISMETPSLPCFFLTSHKK